MKGVLFLCLALFGLVSCSDHRSVDEDSKTLFVSVEEHQSGLEFENTLEYDKDFNIYTYRNFYNGGGVAIGDINNDGLPDIYLTANMGPNKLFLNKGNFQFEDITEKAHVAGSKAWSTGVSMADINADGFLDIYVCNSGDIKGDSRQNELFINNGDNTFVEQASQYGLDDSGLSTHAAFFDYDKDGDLDVYILNNSFRPIGSFNLKNSERETRDALGGDKLLRNDDNHFTDVSEEAHIYGSVIGFGLGVIISDLNNDAWPDIYVSNDFFERDYLYLNNHDGTFRETLTDMMQSISMASMGVDATDLTGDGYPEIFVTEMLPKEESRLKTSMTFENWNKYKDNVTHGYHHQFTRNMLHLNSGATQNNEVSFSEVGRMLGVEATDWSWSVLMADVDNNGYKDIYVTNGVYKDILNQDYLRYISSDVVVRSMISEQGVDFKKLIDIIPSRPIPNVIFAGRDDLNFSDSTKAWGLDMPGFSNGAAYGDLDNDGDLDLVVNNINAPASLYRNQTEKLNSGHSFLKVNLKGKGKNTFGVGAKVSLKYNDREIFLEQMPTRGFQSAVDNNLIFGLGNCSFVDSLWVHWPSGTTEIYTEIAVNKMISLEEGKGSAVIQNATSLRSSSLFEFEDVSNDFPADFVHEENDFSDFDNEPLLFHMNSTEGPRLAVGDVNGDQLDDVYLCGARNTAKKLFIQRPGGKFVRASTDAFNDDERCEDVDALFFDADNDNDLDLYVVSGSNEYAPTSSALSDRLYINDGHGNFKKSKQLLPTNQFESTSCVTAADFDDDGDVDLFVGGRLKFRSYGTKQNSYLLKNNGSGIFTNVSSQIAPGLAALGMVKDASFVDYDGDGQDDLIVVGEWMTIRLFRNNNGYFTEVTEEAGLAGFSGWWNRIFPADLDGDGDIDFIAGNHGLNSRFRASKEKPVECYVNDFDSNGTSDPILCTYNGDQSYPTVLLHDLVSQLPSLKKKYLKYEDYKEKRITDIFSSEQINSAIKHSVTTLESAVLINDGNGKFSVTSLPREAQLSPVFGIDVFDFNDDKIPDVLIGGNLYEVKPEMGRYDASFGSLLLGQGDGRFKSIPNKDIQLSIEGQVRDIVPVTVNGQQWLMIARNNDKIQVLRVKQQSPKLIAVK